MGYKKLLLQIGRGDVTPAAKQTPQFTVEYYRYKDCIKGDMQKASLVISHAGETFNN